MKDATNREFGTAAHPLRTEFDAGYVVPVEDTLSGNANANDVQAARNVAGWRQFLPTDCVETMIRLGWDKTA